MIHLEKDRLQHMLASLATLGIFLWPIDAPIYQQF